MNSEVKVVSLRQSLWGVHEFKWGSAIKNTKTGKWDTCFLKPNAQEIDVSSLNVVLHDNGIEFLDEEF
jgi:hypothetical protein